MSRFNPETFIDLAEQLSRHRDQARVRSAISRAYYGAFLLARSIAAVHTRSGEAHRLTQLYFERNGAASIACRLREMRSLRNGADYNVAKSIEQETAKSFVEKARRLCRKMREFRGPRLKVHDSKKR